MTKHTLYLSLGTNLGDRQDNLGKAIDMIDKLIGSVERRSAFYETAPWGFSSDNMFLNAAVRCSTSLSPRQALDASKLIERELGRVSKSVNGEYHDRSIDIDLLLYDDIIVDEPDLKIPHPLMYERDFVMVPLREIME